MKSSGDDSDFGTATGLAQMHEDEADEWLRRQLEFGPHNVSKPSDLLAADGLLSEVRRSGPRVYDLVSDCVLRLLRDWRDKKTELSEKNVIELFRVVEAMRLERGIPTLQSVAFPGEARKSSPVSAWGKGTRDAAISALAGLARPSDADYWESLTQRDPNHSATAFQVLATIAPVRAPRVLSGIENSQAGLVFLLAALPAFLASVPMSGRRELLNEIVGELRHFAPERLDELRDAMLDRGFAVPSSEDRTVQDVGRFLVDSHRPAGETP
jgi:hypothetical protein